jgi:hypothetical protein
VKLSRYFGPLALGAVMAASLAFAQSQPIPGAKTASGQPAPVTGAAIVMAPAGGGAGLGTVVAVDNPLVVNCVSGCSGGGGGSGATASAAATPVTAGTNKPLNIDLFSALRVLNMDASGNVLDPNAPLPTGSNVIGALVANQSVNQAQVNGVAVATGNGVVGTGVQRVAIASDNSALPVNSAQVNGVTMLTGNGVTGTGSLRVTVASDNAGIPVIPSNVVAQGSTTAGQNGALTQGAVLTANPVYTTAQTAPLSLTTSGELRTTSNQTLVNGVAVATGNGVAGTGAQRVAIASDNTAFPIIAAGNVAASATDSGNPVKVGGRFASTVPVLTTGQRGDLMLEQGGSLRVAINGYGATPDDARGTNAMIIGNNGTVTTTPTPIPLWVANSLTDGTNWQRQRSIGDAATAVSGVGVAAVAYAPTASAGQAIVPSSSTAVEGSRVLKASAGNLYRLVVNTGATAGFVGVSNTTTNPADGAVTPLVCRQVAANSTVLVEYALIPARFSVGISAWFSTTGCFTKTQSNTATFEGYIQ